MAENFYTLLTATGKAKLANSATLGAKINFKTLKVGDGNGNYYEPTENQESLVHQVWSGNISSITVDETNTNWIITETIIPATDGGFFIREAGIFDEDGALIAISKLAATYKPIVSEGSTKDLSIKIILEVSNSSSVTLKIDPTVILATKADINTLTSSVNSIKSEVAKVKNKADVTYVDAKIAGAVSGAPKAVSLASQMIDSTKNYVYTGTEAGYTAGNWYYYNGSAWANGGVYQSTGISDGAVTNNKVNDVRFDKVRNTLAYLSDFDKWGSSSNVLTQTLDYLSYKKSTEGDSGVKVLVNLTGINYDTVTVFFTLSKTGSYCDIHVLSVDGAYKGQIGNSLLLVDGANKVTISKNWLTSLGLGEKFQLLFAVHAAGANFTLTNFAINTNGYEEKIVDIVSTIRTEPLTANRIPNRIITSDKLAPETILSLSPHNVLLAEPYLFTGLFDGSYMTMTPQADGSILAVKKDTTGNPALISDNINVAGEYNVGDKYWFTIKAKTTNVGGNVGFYAYRNDTKHTVTSMLRIPLTEEYTEYKGYVIANPWTDDIVPDNVAVHLMTAIQGTVQYFTPRWYKEEPKGTYKDAIDMLVENVGAIDEQVVGQQVDLADSEMYQKVNVTGYHLVTPDIKSNSDNILNEIYVYAEKSGTYKFTIGQIDQNSLVVPSSTFSISCTQGYAKYNLKDKGYSVQYNNMIFMDISSTNILYNPVDTGKKTIKVLVQDETQVTTGNYNGMIMHDSAYMIPFSYTLVSKSLTQKVMEVKESVATTGNLVNSISTSVKNDIILLQPNGNKMMLKADMEGNLVLGNYYPKKVVVLGNSLTAGFGNSGGVFGMCASDQYHDYFNLLKTYLTAYCSQLVMSRITGSPWEGLTSSKLRMDYWINTLKSQFPSDTDLVIIQLVDNVNTAEKEATFAEDAKTLIENVRTQCPKARVIWVAGWYVSTWEIDAIKVACEEKGALFCDITPYKDDAQYKGYIGKIITYNDGSTSTVTSSGVASHPGDLGMQKIAEAIEAVLGF